TAPPPRPGADRGRLRDWSLALQMTPEPSTSILLALGLVVVGVLVRRRGVP
ncbi:MAG: PEP-CTERM sorting domain-containing protein, partial [bacterium]|nr:PEP-CTERM sorting domain-containing protein [bacterium]